ncbi:MAG TPA: AI-2E family transporter [Hyphomicrobiaceae bacterium]|nr:AI-2E family transporter [Hyphomicrobiaceae bacterium]
MHEELSSPPVSGPPQRSGYVTAGYLALAVVALYLGRSIFIPLAVAVLLGFILAPMVLWLRRIGVPRVPAVVVVVLLAFCVLGAISLVVGVQLIELAENLPVYRQNIAAKIAGLKSLISGPGVIDRVTDTLQDIGTVIEQTRPAGEGAPGLGGGKGSPVPVVVSPSPAQPLEVVRNVLGPILGWLATAGVVVVFVVFILIEREDLRDRFIKLAGGDLQRSTEAINEAASRVSRYLVMQLVVNVTYGIPVGVGLWLIGVPNAVLWGLLATILRFIPYVGPWLAAIFPLALAFAVDPGWTMLVWTLTLIITLEVISNNVVEPLLYGSSTGLSSFAIILAAIFWTSLWGPAGLFLATPLTVCLVVLGRYVPHLQFLGVLLGNDPVLAPEERFYQRLLAGNVEEATEMAEEHVEEESSLDFYDKIAVPALRLAASDRERSVDMNFRRAVASTAGDIVEEVAALVSERERVARPKGEKPPEERPRRGRILCIGGRTELDEVAAAMLAQRLDEVGFVAETLAPVAIGRTGLAQIDLDGALAVCLCYLDPDPRANARFACRRLARKSVGVDRVVCLWGLPDSAGLTDDVRTAIGADAFALTMSDVEKHLVELRDRASGEAGHPDRLSSHEVELVRLMRRAGLATGRGQAFETASSEVAEILEGALVLISVIEATKAENDTAPESRAGLNGGSNNVELSIGREVVATGRRVIVEDVSLETRFAEDPVLLEKGIRFYAGVPLRTAAGHVIGVLAAVDSKPRAITDEGCHKLQEIADRLMRSFEETAVKEPLVLNQPLV